MLALFISYFLIAYLLIPRAVFRLADIWLPLKFQRTRTEEVTFAVWISLLPLVLGFAIVLLFISASSTALLANYKLIFAASYSEKVFENSQPQFWISLRNVAISQIDFLAVFYPLIIIEGVIFVHLVNRYGNWRGTCRIYDAFVERVLLRGVSEWYVLLSTFNFPSSDNRRVTADILTVEDHLYQGDVADYYIESDGTLSGLFLENPFRFDRIGYLRAKETNLETVPRSYWKEIPGKNLYIPRDKVLSLNLRYPTSSMDKEAQAASEELFNGDVPIRVQIPSETPLSAKSDIEVSAVRASDREGTT